MLRERVLDRVVGHHRAVLIVDDREKLLAVDVNEQIVLTVNVERCRRIRRGDEHEAANIFEAGVLERKVTVGARHRKKCLLQHGAISGMHLDALEHHPGAAGLDAADDLLRIEIDHRDGVRVLSDLHLAGVELDVIARQLTHELDDAREREQRIVR